MVVALMVEEATVLSIFGLGALVNVLGFVFIFLLLLLCGIWGRDYIV